MYLDRVLVLFTRKIVGWCLSDRVTTDLVVTALDAVYEQLRRAPEVLYHFDRGAWYVPDL